MQKKSGRICFGEKSFHTQFIFILDTDNHYVLWFVLFGKLINSEDILFDVVYVPPEYSEYATADPFSEVQIDIDSL